VCAGLPAENAARHHGMDPAKWTSENVDTMRRQLQMLGVMFDWDRVRVCVCVCVCLCVCVCVCVCVCYLL
jgi:hypothetical protein